MILKNKTAVISGVGERFGKAAAILFAREGARVILISRKEDIVKKIAEEINRNGGKADYRIFDASNSKDVEENMKKIGDDFENIDILFNNAGGFYSKKQKLHEMNEEFWDEVIKNNLRTLFLMSKSAINNMKKNRKGGSIINVSAADKTLLDGNSAYSAAKGGVIALTKNLAREVKEENIRVNCIRPGVVRNNFNHYNLENPPSKLNRKGNSEDIAYAALFLASEYSSWITGQELVVDGGESLYLFED